ncbi:hypothetical protein BC830DRAFT_1099164 [Chytriomyces sp. MP71]|nr:hypothetical protein BC830DRAFT_1099164 [Chytriomyces sp. MP71]
MSVFSEILAHETGSFPVKTKVPPTTVHGAIFVEKLPTMEALTTLWRTKAFTQERFISTLVMDPIKQKYMFVPVEGEVDLEGHHFIQTTVDSEDGVRAYVESTFSRDWVAEIRAGRPLWYLHIIENTTGLSAIVLEFHHAIGDGMSLVMFFSSLYTDENGNELPLPSTAKTAPVSKRQKKVHPVYKAVYQALLVARGFFKIVLGSLMWTDSPTKIKGHSHINHVHGGSRKIFQLPPLNLEAVKAIKSKLGCSVNDVVTSALAGAIRRYLKYRNDPYVDSPFLQIRALMPYAFPRMPPAPDSVDAAHMLHNGWTVISVPLAVRITRNAAARVRQTKAIIDTIKVSAEPYIATALQNLVYNVAGYTVAAQITADFYLRHTITFTNVPAFAEKPYICGQRVELIQPYVSNAIPQLSVVSCAGVLYGNFCVDPEVFQEGDALGKFLVRELEQLADETGVSDKVLMA